MTTLDKKDEKLCSSIIGNEFESYEDFKAELVRRDVVLDFLALYLAAREDNVVERVKHIVHAKHFLDHKPKHWEQYLTRLLGRCLRHHCPGYQAVEKERNSFVYNVHISQDYPALKQILNMRKLVQLDFPWYLHGHGEPYTRYRQNPQLYWRTRGLAEPTDVDAMFAAWNRFYDQTDRYARAQMTGSVVKVHYGHPGYIGQRRWYRSYNNPAYHAYEAYSDFKQWIRLANEFLENDAPFDTYRILNEHNKSDDYRIERELREHAENQAEYLRERARAEANRRARENTIDYDEQGQARTPLAEQLMTRFRQRGLVNDA